MTKKPENPFFGKWIVMSHELKSPQGKWSALDYFIPGLYLWEFTEDRDFLRDGYLERSLRGGATIREEFRYNAREARLSTDKPGAPTYEQLREPTENGFRVVRRDRQTLILYALDDIRNEPEDYLERFVIRKHP